MAGPSLPLTLPLALPLSGERSSLLLLFMPAALLLLLATAVLDEAGVAVEPPVDAALAGVSTTVADTAASLMVSVGRWLSG